MTANALDDVVDAHLLVAVLETMARVMIAPALFSRRRRGEAAIFLRRAARYVAECFRSEIVPTFHARLTK